MSIKARRRKKKWGRTCPCERFARNASGGGRQQVYCFAGERKEQQRQRRNIWTKFQFGEIRYWKVPRGKKEVSQCDGSLLHVPEQFEGFGKKKKKKQSHPTFPVQPQKTGDDEGDAALRSPQRPATE
ncbi:uncharacterized protein TM35_000022340 [Trypanosoma theileri]|uniref:Uncharacterized protein n=1 Tax=Trypanosoma theileri TaxID=67003 RepID=A0A1X0P7Q4_9TRYP|nr:uncharacterized protein TM35_000022340 [Trypanosoma theileri]ORC92908.1 hypothetical protein TM35_000022340 [Trypanosoma theileri]